MEPSLATRFDPVPLFITHNPNFNLSSTAPENEHRVVHQYGTIGSTKKLSLFPQMQLIANSNFHTAQALQIQQLNVWGFKPHSTKFMSVPNPSNRILYLSGFTNQKRQTQHFELKPCTSAKNGKQEKLILSQKPKPVSSRKNHLNNTTKQQKKQKQHKRPLRKEKNSFFLRDMT